VPVVGELKAPASSVCPMEIENPYCPNICSFSFSIVFSEKIGDPPAKPIDLWEKQRKTRVP